MAGADAGKTFSIATTVEDPLTAERLVELLREHGLDAFARARGAASADSFGAASKGYYELLVPTDALEKATAAITAELQAMEADAEDAGKAAEEEAMSGENSIPES